jgi:hypothetical protein
MPNGDFFTDAELKDRIYLAQNEAEILLKTTITRESFKEKVPFDRSLYQSFIQITSANGPIISLEYLSIVSADTTQIFTIPSTWIEAANFSSNIIHVIPLLAAYGMNTVTGSAPGNAGVAYLTILGGLSFVPAFWEISYTAGLSNIEGNVPAVVNELVGCIATIDLLSQIAPNFSTTSQSQSQDGISQASSGPGNRIYAQRIDELEKKKEDLVKKLRNIFSRKYFINNV